MPQALPLIALAATIGGTAMSISSAHAQASAQGDALQAQQKAEGARQQAMELDARRKQVEQLRTQQRARSLALSGATASGSQLGSGLQGGYGQISGGANNNIVGTGQSLELGRDIFSANSELTNARIGMANAQSGMYMGQGISSIGKSVMSDMGTIKNLGKEYGFWNTV